MTNTSRRALVIGGGPAGACTAFWLAKGGFQVTVAERSTSKFAYGQGIDLTGPAIPVIKKMGLYEKIRENTTGEGGMTMVDDNANDIAAVGTAPEDASTASWIQEIEIMRGKCTELFAERAQSLPNVTYRYGCTLSGIRESDSSVTAVLSDSGEQEEFAFVIGADGQNSHVRSLIFDPEINKACLDAKNVYTGYFSMAGDPEHDLPNSRVQNSTGGRAIFIRPIDREGSRVSCYIIAVGEYPELAKLSESGSATEQKEELAKLFEDFPGLGERARWGLRREADDFYFTRIVQVKLDSWHRGRCGLVGDAGYAPSPLTGQGTTLATLGAYVIAGELASNLDNPSAAFAQYEKKLHDYVRREQKIPFRGKGPELLNPQTGIGIALERSVFKAMAQSKIWKLIDIGKDEDFPLPEYNFG
ncbi:hypothetical protein M409DRAFT_62414 [Zasmidium cellare ATCC 36951]|uniref:FAD-binding domain-containing protein n=1 Tax=Zasmidium cellare ATCC 36951 TaxID=1080233 RepID=A0A6A6CZX2_ZASCE|nr:uncharacterized protein M409DRAFT_62414 [Zasmidium cellare ATCC 36951]KAF2172661.1 hypothetical protein M409DRAFT_62414 [Zasmidium cellare ATCC 36951]